MVSKISKPTKTCGDGKGRCKTHGRACLIGLDYDDSRKEALERAFEIEGVTQKFSHTIESTHYCDICMRERREGLRPGYYGYDHLTQQVMPTQIITKNLKDQQKRYAEKQKRMKIATGEKKAFGNRRHKNKK